MPRRRYSLYDLVYTIARRMQIMNQQHQQMLDLQKAGNDLLAGIVAKLPATPTPEDLSDIIANQQQLNAGLNNVLNSLNTGQPPVPPAL